MKIIEKNLQAPVKRIDFTGLSQKSVMHTGYFTV